MIDLGDAYPKASFHETNVSEHLDKVMNWFFETIFNGLKRSHKHNFELFALLKYFYEAKLVYDLVYHTFLVSEAGEV